jgi:cation-transporting ATPase 13A1
MKEAIIAPTQSEAESEEVLDMMGMHRVNTLFSGCSIVTITSRNKKSDENDVGEGSSSIPEPPDNGAVAYVLRTGFGSSQGSLLQMIEFSQQSVSGDSKETGLALFLLFIFALIASGYVLKEGLRKREKTTHELLLRCVIIITSVVPRQFPMQVGACLTIVVQYCLYVCFDIRWLSL